MSTVAATIAVIASRVRREERSIFAALERRGIGYEHVDPRGLYQPAGAPARWQLVLNREIAQTRALYVALALEAAGARVVNSAAATETCGDKWRTAIALTAAGVPTPRTVLALTPAAACEAAADAGYPVVFKPLSASWGRRVALVQDAGSAETLMEYCAAIPGPHPHLLCVQQPIDKPDRDIRVIVVGGCVLGAVYRQDAGWRTNVAMGARTQPCPLTEEIAKLATEAAAAVGAEIAGVDLLEGPDGDLSVLEVNSGVEFGGFVSALQVDVAAAIVGHLTTLEIA